MRDKYCKKKKYRELSFGGDIIQTTKKSQEKKLKSNDTDKKKRHTRWCLKKFICKIPVLSTSKMQ